MATATVGISAGQTADFTKRLVAGQQLRARDHFAQARVVYQTLLREVRKGPANPRCEALVFDSMAINEQDSGDYGAAETAFNHGIAAIGTLDEGDPVLIALKSHLAELYIAEFRPEDAEPLLRQAISALRKSTMLDSMALSIANEDLAVTDIMRRKYAEPEPLLREAQALIESLGGPNDPKLTASLLTYAGLMTAQRRYAEALAPAERAWKLLGNSARTIPKPYLASAESVLGAVYYHLGRYDDAESAARQSVELAQASLGPEHPRLGLYLANYAVILKAVGRKGDAKAVRKRADAILDQHPSSLTGGYTINVASLR